MAVGLHVDMKRHFSAPLAQLSSWAKNITGQQLCVNQGGKHHNRYMRRPTDEQIYWWTLITSQELGRSDLVNWVYRSSCLYCCPASWASQPMGCLFTFIFAVSLPNLSNLYSFISTLILSELFERVIIHFSFKQNFSIVPVAGQHDMGPHAGQHDMGPHVHKTLCKCKYEQKKHELFSTRLVINCVIKYGHLHAVHITSYCVSPRP